MGTEDATALASFPSKTFRDEGAARRAKVAEAEREVGRLGPGRQPPFAVALAALVVALGGTAIAAGDITGTDQPATVLKLRVTRDGKLIGTHNDGTVKKAGVGVYEITFSTGPTGSKVPLNLDECAIIATPRVEHESTPDEVSADVDLQRLGGSRIYVESTRPLPFGEGKIVPFLTNVSFDVAAIC